MEVIEWILNLESRRTMPTWHARWTISQLFGIYLKCQWGKRPVDKIWKSESPSKKLGRWWNEPLICNIPGQPDFLPTRTLFTTKPLPERTASSAILCSFIEEMLSTSTASTLLSSLSTPFPPHWSGLAQWHSEQPNTIQMGAFRDGSARFQTHCRTLSTASAALGLLEIQYFRP